MEFCDVPLPAIVANLEGMAFQEGCDRAEVGICLRSHWTLPKAASLARLDYVFTEKILAENWRCGALFLNL